MPKLLGWVLTVILVFLGREATATGELSDWLAALRAAGPSAAGSREAAAAWERVAKIDADRLPAVLAAIDGTGPIAANWLRTAVDAIAERSLREGKGLPSDELERFIRGLDHDPKARRLAYEWLLRVDPSAPERLLPDMLNDPSLELRRDAIARLVGEAVQVEESSGPAKAVPLYRRALTHARDRDQIDLLAKRLRNAGEEVDLARHFGFVLRWQVIGPFDNSAGNGFDTGFPPEQGMDFQSAYEGKHGQVTWVEYVSTDDDGKIDLNQAISEEKEVTGYAAAHFVSQRRREVEVRVTSGNAIKVWLNGMLIDQHNIYHAGSRMDQYRSRGVLQPGRNTILVKVCQNEQTQDWARNWGFQLRVCDSTGGAILSVDRDD